MIRQKCSPQHQIWLMLSVTMSLPFIWALAIQFLTFASFVPSPRITTGTILIFIADCMELIGSDPPKKDFAPIANPTSLQTASITVQHATVIAIQATMRLIIMIFT